MRTLHTTVDAILIADDPTTFVSRRIPEAQLTYGGIEGDRHFGITSLADSRQPMYPRGTPIFNRRQITIVSIEECQQIANNLGIDHVLPEWLGANILVKGFGNLTELTMGSRLMFPSGVGLLCMGENQPCTLAGEQIQNHFEKPGLKAKFVKAGYKRRGIVCLVETPGLISLEDDVKVLVNDFQNPMQ